MTVQDGNDNNIMTTTITKSKKRRFLRPLPLSLSFASLSITSLSSLLPSCRQRPVIVPFCHANTATVRTPHRTESASSSSPLKSIHASLRRRRTQERHPPLSSSSSSSSSSSCSLAILVNSLSFVPSSLTLADPLSANMALVSVLYIRIAFFKVVYAVNESKATRETTKSASGSNLFKNAPIKAPAIVNGSMTKIKSQSTRGRSARGCLFFTFNMVLATAPPKTVMLESGMACLGEKPMTRM
mmetsp:Transcript_7158/g.15392  ORF Transcript_7158/g.15392 Transcript_7158/m.15392 type:complete len:242 (-) Transcript_7158:484-1209(-)